MADVTTPVLIVGGGPAGLAASICLSQLGIRSVLVEQHATTTAHPKATVVNTRTFELFRQWGIEADVRQGGLPLDKSRFILWATTLTGYELGRLDLAERPGDADADPTAPLRHFGKVSPAFTGICPQDIYEPILRRKAESGATADVRFHTQLVSFHAGDDGVDAVIRGLDDGREQTVYAQYLLGCDGAASGIRERLGITMLGPDNIGSILNIYFHADLTPHISGREGALYWIVNADVPGVFIALNNSDRWLFNTPFRLEAGETVGKFTPESCRALVHRAIGDAAVAVDVRSVDPWIMQSQVAERYQAGRVFLIGDAAHRFPPTGGFGMNTGVQDAHNLAWKIAGVLHGWAAPALLETYEPERRPVGQFNADQSLKNTRQMPTPHGADDGAASPLAMIEDDSPDGEAMRQMIAAGIGRTREHFSAQGQAKGFAYASAAISADGTSAAEARSTVENYVPTARPGSLAPHAWVRRDGQLLSLLDLYGSRFVLLTGPRGAGWQRAAEDVMRATHLPLSIYTIGGDVLPEGTEANAWCALYGVGEDGAVLVRPDGHVAWRMDGFGTTAAADLKAACERAVGGSPGPT